MSVESEHTGDMSLKPIKDSFIVVVMLKRIHITVKLVIFANSQIKRKREMLWNGEMGKILAKIATFTVN